MKKAGSIKYVTDKIKHKHNRKAAVSTADPKGEYRSRNKEMQ